MIRKLLSIIACSFAVACGSGEKASEDAPLKQNFAAQLNIVDTIHLTRGDFQKQLVSNGKLMAKHKSDLRFATSGEIVEIAAQNGEWVNKGHVIARQDSQNAALALKEAEVAIKTAQIAVEDYLIGQGYGAGDTVPQKIVDAAHIKSGYSSALLQKERAEQSIEDAKIVAPFSGKIASLSQRVSEYSGDEFCTIIDDSSFDVDFSVLESELAFVEVGSPVKATTFAGEAAVASGRVSAINPIVESNGQVKIRATISKSKGFMEGMNVKVLVENKLQNMLVVPKNAVVIRDNMDVLFTYNPDTKKAVWTYINILYGNSTSYAVEANLDRTAQLASGDIVIVKGNLNLADGSEVELSQD